MAAKYTVEHIDFADIELCDGHPWLVVYTLTSGRRIAYSRHSTRALALAAVRRRALRQSVG